MIRKWMFVLFLFANSLFASEENLEKIFKKASTYFKAKEMQKAIPLFNEALNAASPGVKRDVILYNLGVSYLENGQFQEAVENLEKVFEKKEKLPKDLLEKTSYNLMLSYLNESEKILFKVEGVKEDFLKIKEMLKKSEEILKTFPKESEGYKEVYQKMKGLKSQFYYKEQAYLTSQLSLEQGITKLKDCVYNQVVRYEKLGLKEIGPSMVQYFLSKDYASDQKLIHVWDRVKEILENKIEENKLKKENTVSQYEACLDGFQESYNEFISSLDCMKENKLWLGRLKSVKSKINLDLIDIFLKNEDPIDYCLDQRIRGKEKQSKVQRASVYYNSISKEIKLLSHIAYSYLEEGVKALQTKEGEDTALYISLSNVLKSHLKTGSNFEYDKYLYETSKKEPWEILLPIYHYYSNFKSADNEKDKKHQNQIKASSKRFDLQSKLDYEEPKKQKVLFAKEKISDAYSHFLEKDFAGLKSSLEEFLVNWGFKPFMLLKLSEVNKNHSPFCEKIIHPIAHQALLSDLLLIDNLQKKAIFALEEKKESLFLHSGLKEAILSINLNAKINDLELKRHLLKNGDQWLQRLTNYLKDEKKSSVAIIQNGILEQKNALGFAEKYPEAIDLDPELDKSVFEMSTASQNYPLLAVSAFISTFHNEQSQKDAEQDNKDVLIHFENGLKEANKAKQLLENKVIDWKRVAVAQTKVIENWEKILHKLENQNSQNSQDGEAQDKQEDPNQKEDTQNESDISSSEEMKEEQNSPKDHEKIMGILERLNEMQQEDKIVNKKNQSTKKGLRPW